jgi:parallel beta-helix repeat protein
LEFYKKERIIMFTKKNLLACICVGLIAFSFVFTSPARAANSYYVSKSGNDSNPGTLAQPFLTIQKGMNKLAAGDSLFIRGGTYAEFVTISKSSVTVSGYPGETAVLDGSSLLTSPAWSPQVTVSGSNVILQNLEITNPNGLGVWGSNVSSTNNVYRGLNIHHVNEAAMNIWGSKALIEGNTIHHAGLMNRGGTNGSWPGVLFVGDVSRANAAPYAVVRNNTIYDNWGEGLIIGYSDNALVEGNILYDNWAEGIYIDGGSLTTVRNNLVYYTTDKQWWRFATPAAGIEWATEGRVSGYSAPHDIKIYNNIVINAGWGIYWWRGATNSAVTNVIVANNTVINTAGYGSGITIDNSSGLAHSNSIIQNNIVAMNGGTLASGSTSGITWKNNLWSRQGGVSGQGDIIASPLFVVGSGFDPKGYALQSSSPAIGRALALAEVSTDYFKNARGSAPTIGGIEYNGSAQPTRTPTSTPTPAFTKTPTPQPTVPPGAFKKGKPVSGVKRKASTLTLTWSSSSKRSNYEYCIDTINDKACNTTWISTNVDSKITLGPLPPGTYYWQVRAINANGTTYANGKTTSWWKFTIAP